MGEAAGNATQAARLAGYRGNLSTLGTVAVQNMQKDAILEAIETLRKKDKLVMSRIERRRFWTKMANDPEVENSVRIRASELLARASGDFIERHQVESKVSVKDEREGLRELLENPSLVDEVLDLTSRITERTADA